MPINFTTAPRRDLVKVIHRLARERDIARREALNYLHQIAPDWHRWTAEECRRHAQAHLDLIGPDPQARRHLIDLAAELDLIKRPQPPGLVHPRRPGPRCTRGRVKPCGKPLDENGWCSTHDARRRKAHREGVAA